MDLDLVMSQVTAKDEDKEKDKQKKFTEAMDLAQVMLTVADDGLAGLAEEIVERIGGKHGEAAAFLTDYAIMGVVDAIGIGAGFFPC